MSEGDVARDVLEVVNGVQVPPKKYPLHYMLLWDAANNRSILARCDAAGNLLIVATITGTVDVSDRWARQVGQVDLARYSGAAVGLANPLHTQTVFGGAVIDPRSIRALIAADIVTVNNLLNPHPVSLASIPNPPNLDVALSTRLKIADYTMASFFSFERWGIAREPFWVDGAEATAPGAGTALVTKAVTALMTGRVFGVSITADEANSFQLKVGAAVIKRYALGGAGTIFIQVAIPLKDGIAAASSITIVNVGAGGGGKVYQASLLYDEA